jgi:hypothetical protein
MAAGARFSGHPKESALWWPIRYSETLFSASDPNNEHME